MIRYGMARCGYSVQQRYYAAEMRYCTAHKTKKVENSEKHPRVDHCFGIRWNSGKNKREAPSWPRNARETPLSTRSAPTPPVRGQSPSPTLSLPGARETPLSTCPAPTPPVRGQSPSPTLSLPGARLAFSLPCLSAVVLSLGRSVGVAPRAPERISAKKRCPRM